MSPDLLRVQAWVDVVQGVLISPAVTVAGSWFLRTARAKPRIRLDLDCHLFPIGLRSKPYLAEISYVFTNTSFFERRIRRTPARSRPPNATQEATR